MKTTTSLSTHLLILFIVIIFSWSCPAHSHGHHDFLRCLNNSAISDLLYAPNNSSYSRVLDSSIRNLRFTFSSTPKPLIIVTPKHESQIRAVVLCSKQYGIQIRTRSGGHDYEGLSYTSNSNLPFVIIDLINLSKVRVDDVKRKTAWVEAGATIGQLYYAISEKSRTLAFPSGTCPTVGVGGHFSGGGYGTLFRKYGLAADNIIDARLIDVNGNILDRESMGEELFWAIRGGGGASFGVITAWKVKLVHVPKVVTVFSVTRSSEQNVTKLLHQWQYVAPNLPKDVFSSITIRRVNSSETGRQTIQATFESLFLGGAKTFLQLFEQRFQELGAKIEDCTEVSWIQSVLFFSGYPLNVSTQVLASRTPLVLPYFKAKSDYVQASISKSGIQGMWKLFYERKADAGFIQLTSYGGKMNDISESAVPFPHRAGNLYKIQYFVYWFGSEEEASQWYISWIRRLYEYMTPYVSKSPRAAYVNYRDLDLGVNNEGNTSYAQASIWGLKYFKSNFDRLVRVKSMVDPGNFFKNEQSIPSLY